MIRMLWPSYTMSLPLTITLTPGPPPSRDRAPNDGSNAPGFEAPDASAVFFFHDVDCVAFWIVRRTHDRTHRNRRHGLALSGVRQVKRGDHPDPQAAI